MKNLFLIAILVLGFSAVSFGQDIETATSSATIVTPISLTKTSDMNFGNVAVHATNDGTVVLVPAGTRTGTAGVTVSAALAGTVSAASFTVNGANNQTYSITLPAVDHEITRSGGTEVMQVNTFTSDPSGTGTLSAGGAQTINIGATLNVSGGQTPGIYTNASGFEVTVNYN
jgi:hypothetical protein